MLRQLIPTLTLLITLLATTEIVATVFFSSNEGSAELTRALTVHNVLDQIVRLEESPILPLAGISRKLTHLCREADGPVVYEADRFGFNNDDQLWDREIDLVLLGDSFVHGHCVPEAAQLATLMRSKYPDTLNLALRGSGPLSQLGVLQEYALPVLVERKTPGKAKKIYWFILANDLFYDLEREIRAPLLISYFKEKTQNLRARQGEIDELLAGIHPPHEVLAAGRPLLTFPDALTRILFSLVRPEPLRTITGEGDPGQVVADRRLRFFVDVLQKGAQLAAAQDVGVEFIFIPDSWVFSKSRGAGVQALIARLGAEMQARGLKFVDPTPAYMATGQPFSYYAALDGYYGHFTPAGFRLLADQILKLDSTPH